MRNKWIVGTVLLGLSLVIIFKGMELFLESKQLDVVKTSFRKIDEFPDPTEINTSGKWYLLNHISSPLIEYNHKSSSFKPLIASSWDINGSTYSFSINPEAKFSDGTPIKASDVAKTIKRILVRKKSTHFPLWNHVLGCDHLNSISESCEGLSFDDQKNIFIVNLKGRSDSFLLQISSPESGIWSAQDIKDDSSLVATKYSGPYELENLKVNSNKEFILKRNSQSMLQKEFLESPLKIIVHSFDRSEIEKSIVDGLSDIFIGDFIPYNEYDWDQLNFAVHYTTPSSIIYFFGLNTENKIGLDLLDALSEVQEKRLSKANTFLPFASEVALARSDFAQIMPIKSVKVLKIAAPGFYFKDQFLEYLKASALKIGITLKITKIERAEYLELVTSRDDYKGKYDFLLGSYVASERYPAVQLRFLTGARTPQVDLSDVELPDQNPIKIKRLKDYQTWLLKSQTVIPIFFIRSHIVSSPQIDIGDQPTTDADIQLWRLTKKSVK